MGAEFAQSVENTVLICNILRTPDKRAKVIAQLLRLRHDRKRRYDPRNAVRLISQRLHYPHIAVELVIQGQAGEMEIWLREFRAVRARAEQAIEQFWMGRVA